MLFFIVCLGIDFGFGCLLGTYLCFVLWVLDWCLGLRLRIDIRNDVSFGYYFELLFGGFWVVSL